MIVLNYRATSDQIHLFVYDKEGGDILPENVQPAVEGPAPEYNHGWAQRDLHEMNRHHRGGTLP